MKPTFDQILLADIRKPKQKAFLIKYISELPWLKKNHIEVNLDNLDILYHKLRHKYPFTIAYIRPTSDTSWNVMIKTTDTHQWINTIYIQTFFEMYLKVIIIVDAYFNQGNLQHDEKGKSNEEK